MSGTQNNHEEKNTNYLKIGMVAIAAIGLAYSISVYLLGFLYFSNIEKILVFSGLSFFFFSILLLVPQSAILQVTEIFQRLPVKQKIIMGLLAITISVLAFLVFLPFVPTSNTFELSILQENSSKNVDNRLDILQIDRLGSNNQVINQISPDKLKLIGNWVSDKNSISIDAAGGGSIQFTDFSSNGISLTLIKGPDLGKVRVDWNGQSQMIDLHNDTFDQVVIDFPRSFSFHQTSPIRIIQVVFLLISNFISFVFLLFLILSIYPKRMEFRGYFESLRLYQKLFFFGLVITFFYNIYAFSLYQSTDVLYLRRSSSNSLIALDNANEDNFPYFQVYYKLSQNYRDYKLVVPSEIFTDGKVLTFARLKEDRLMELGRLNSVVEEDYSSELSFSQLAKIEKMKREFSPPMGSIVNDFVYVLEPDSQNKMMCLWWSKQTVFFIPVQKDLDCQKAKQ